MELLYYCEKCGKPVYEKFGSGRFCSRSCANSREMTAEIRDNISRGMRKLNYCNCQFCGKEFNNLNDKGHHEIYCNLNPNHIERINYGAQKNHNNKLKRNVKVSNYDTKESVELDITYGELEDYRLKHKTCEICGKSIENLSLPTSKVEYKNLSIDHDHNTNRFRGLLCSTCNRELGWYENNKDAIEKYLNKNMGH